LVTVILPGRLIPHFGLRHGQKLATPRQLVLAVAMGEEAVVADALKAFGQNVQQEAADELVGSERHRFLSVAVAIVFPAEADPAFLDGKKAVVGESDAMGVSRDISQNLFGAGEGGLGIDAPCDRRSPGKEDGCNLKPFEAIQRVRRPPGRGAARQPEANLAREAATSLAKRRQRKLKPCVSLEIMYPLRPSVWVGRGRCRHDR